MKLPLPFHGNMMETKNHFNGNLEYSTATYAVHSLPQIGLDMGLRNHPLYVCLHWWIHESIRARTEKTRVVGFNYKNIKTRH